MKPLLKAVKAALGRAFAAIGKLPAKRVEMAIAILVTVAALVVYAFVGIPTDVRAAFSFVQTVEHRSLDGRFRLRGERPHDGRIVIVGIDEKTLQKVGAWPIPRDAYAKLIDQLNAGGAKIISFDVTFPNPEKNSAVEALKKLEAEVGTTAPAALLQKIKDIERTSDNDATLAESLKRAGNVLLGQTFLGGERARAISAAAAEDYFSTLWLHPFPQVLKVSRGGDFDLNAVWKNVTDPWGVADGAEANIRLLGEAARSFGFFNYVADDDGVFRRAPMLIRYQNRDFFPSLPLETVRQYENIKDQSIAAYIAPDGMERIELGPHKLNTDAKGRTVINYAGGYQTYKHYSMGDVIDGTVPAETFKDKIVLVGATALGIGDLRVTPFATTDYMGVEIHANVLDNLLHSDEPGRGFLKRGGNEEMIDLAFIVAFGLGMGYLFSRIKPLLATVSVIVALGLFLAITYYSFAIFGIWLYVVIPAGALIANYGAITSHRMIFEEREKRKVRKTFERYVSPGVIRLIEKDPKKYFKAGGESKELTVMFSDIRDFTSVSESLTPDDLVALLNEYLGEMTELLFKRWGTLDKYIGDAVMAFWGSPFPQDDHAVRACACALDMSARLEELNLKWEVEGKKPLRIGIGVNSGRVSVGNMGSDRRFAWTVMGDNVNLASRLEGLNKEYKSTRIISEFTYAQVKQHYVCRDLDKIRVKGKLQPVGIYELLGFAADGQKHRELLAAWSDAQAAYRRHNWEEAAQKFEAMTTRFPDDGPAHIFLKRALEFMRQAPAPDWDGVYVMKTK
jgi:adenylate cyclase